MPEVGVKVAEQLLELMADTAGAIAPKLVRVRVPALVRGDNMVTTPHENIGYVDTLMQRVIALEAEPGVIAAALCWGNPFTDVPELLCQVLVLVDSNSPAQVRFQEKNLDFLFKNLHFLIKNLHFIIIQPEAKARAGSDLYLKTMDLRQGP